MLDVRPVFRFDLDLRAGALCLASLRRAPVRRSAAQFDELLGIIEAMVGDGDGGAVNDAVNGVVEVMVITRMPQVKSPQPDSFAPREQCGTK